MSTAMKCHSCSCECACYPQPSREALEKILFPHAEPQVPSLAENWLIDKVMAWATGQWKRVWCKHLMWNSTSYWMGELESENGVMRVPDEWMVCPLCAAPRPNEV